MPSAPSATTAADRTARKFIGAVEDEWQLYSDRASDYTRGPPIGYGASSIVYAATFQPAPDAAPTPCALKVVDLDRLPPHALNLLMQETQLMSLSKHPNVLRVRGTWMDGHKLYIALRLMNAGSAADVMRYAWTGGMEEEVVKCILKQALEGLNYLHVNGLIHRDVKAANLLIDDDGTVLLGDLGVAAPLWDTDDTPAHTRKTSIIINSASGFRNPHTQPTHIYTHGHGHNNHTHTHTHRQRAMGKRKSFVGTPCWMAPEVITGKQYDASADIWSFGITALELTQGRAPHSRAAPSSVLMQVATAPPPKMDRNAGVHNYSAAFADIIEQCLQKDPAKRPTAQDLLNSSFFKGAKKKGYLVGAVLKNLPPLVQRQEKRRVPSLMTHATMDSWDFSIRGGEDAVGSPTTSVYSVHSHSRRPRSALPKDGLAELAERQPHLRRPQSTEPAHEEDAAAYARRIRERHRSGSRSHSRSVSWADSDDGSLPSAHQAHPAPIAEVDILSSSPRSSEGVPAPAAALADPDTKADAAQGYSAHEVDLNRLAAPRARRPSLSPTPSYSNASSSESNSVSTSTDPSEAVTPPQSVAAPSPGLWRRLVGRGEPKLGKGERERAGDREREREKEEGDAGFRRKALGGVSILAGRSAGLVRTVSRVGTGK